LIPVDQTTFYDPEIPGNGNCTEAAVASILGIPLSDVPKFYTGAGAYDFWERFEDFFVERGYFPVRRSPSEPRYDLFYLASGPAERGCDHMVVMRGNELAHDPHPSRAGLISVTHTWLIVLADAAKQAA